MRNFKFDNKFQFSMEKMQMTALELPAWQAFVNFVFCLQGGSGINKNCFDRQKVSKTNNKIINSVLTFLKAVCMRDFYLESHFYGMHLYLSPPFQVFVEQNGANLCVWCNK